MCAVLFFATLYACALIAMNGIGVKVTVSKAYTSDDVDEQVRQGAGDVVVEDGDASVRLDATDL